MASLHILLVRGQTGKISYLGYRVGWTWQQNVVGDEQGSETGQLHQPRLVKNLFGLVHQVFLLFADRGTGAPGNGFDVQCKDIGDAPTHKYHPAGIVTGRAGQGGDHGCNRLSAESVVVPGLPSWKAALIS